jgi:hypothetical protein
LSVNTRNFWSICCRWQIKTFIGFLYIKFSRGRCYDHNFLRFLPIFCEKMAFFSRTTVKINFCKNYYYFDQKTPNFRQIFQRKYFLKS